MHDIVLKIFHGFANASLYGLSPNGMRGLKPEDLLPADSPSQGFGPDNIKGIDTEHPLVIPREILMDIPFPWPVAETAYQHHERMNGSGYPLGLRGREIMREARIIAVADIVEAMSMHHLDLTAPGS